MMRRVATRRLGDSASAMATDARARATRAVYLRETVISKLRLARTLSDTAVYKSYARRSELAMKYTLTIYEQRKMLFLAVAHAMATMVVWSHFFLVKYRATAKVPRGANLYWWKRLTPPFEFGAMHAILFQMALLPLTMARQSVAALSTTSFGRKFVPLHKVVAMHIHLGYVMVSFVFASTILFFVFFGQGCAQQKSGKEPTPGGQHTFCHKMTSEIMATGLAIMGCLLLVAVTSYARNRIKYEIFYYVHHFVFIMFALAIAHTLDDKARRGQVRSQNFKWFSASLVWYLTDRLQASFNIRDCDVVECVALGDDEPESRKVVHLRIVRPETFIFRPGQYVFINDRNIDYTWHPYSIASSPHEDTIDFYIEVMSTSRVDGANSWTNKLWRDARDGFVSKMRINGPYGTGFNDIDDKTQIVAIGAGTGIVPMLSLAKAKVNEFVRMNAQARLSDLAARDAKNRKFADNYFKESYTLKDFVYKQLGLAKKESKASEMWASRSVQDIFLHKQCAWREAKLREEGDNATKRHYERLLTKNVLHEVVDLTQIGFPLLDLTSIALLLSFSKNFAIATQAMREVPLWAFFVCHCYFFVHWVFTRMNAPIWWIDLIFNATSTVAFTAWYNLIREDRKEWNVYMIWAFAALSVYRIARISSDVLLTGTPGSRAVNAYLEKTGDATSVTEKFTLIFMTPQVDFCQILWRDLDSLHQSITKNYGEQASRVFDIQVYCTSRDSAENEELKKRVKGTSLGAAGALHMERPDLDEITLRPVLQQVLKDQFTGEDRPSFTASLVAFCGGTQLGSKIALAVVRSRARVKAFTENHSIEFLQENYGQATPAKDRGRASFKQVRVEPAPTVSGVVGNIVNVGRAAANVAAAALKTVGPKTTKTSN
jgi:predicted ferric reductase